MTKIIIKLITTYQRFLSPIIKQLLGINAFCRYPLSCSHYAKKAIKKEGAVNGSIMAIKRILDCQPFGKNKYEYI